MDPSPETPDVKIPHQQFTEEVVADVIEASVGKDHANITDAVVAHTLNATYSHTEAEAALNALGTKVNAILAVLRDIDVVG